MLSKRKSIPCTILEPKIYDIGAMGKPTNIMLLKGYNIIPTLNDLLLYTQHNISQPLFEALLIAAKVINRDSPHQGAESKRIQNAQS